MQALPEWGGYGMNLAESPDVFTGGNEAHTILVKPESPIKGQSVILIPGIGVNIDTVKGSFTETGNKIATTLKTLTAICVEGKWDNKKLSGFPESGIAWALRRTINELPPGDKLHLIACSHNATNVLTVASFSGIIRRVSSVILLAPTDSPYNIVQIFEEGGRLVEKTGDKVTVGNRKTILPWIISSGHSESDQMFTEKLITASDILKQHGVKLNILLGGIRDDIVPVKVSEELAKQLNISFTQLSATDGKIVPGSAVHDFATEFLRQSLIDLLQQNMDLTK